MKEYPQAYLEGSRTAVVIPPHKLVSVLGPDLYDIRESGEFKGRGLWLNEDFDWELVRDSEGTLCLLALKR